jgi:hypothetical protein
MSYAMVDVQIARKWEPRVIVLGEKNAVVNRRGI